MAVERRPSLGHRPARGGRHRTAAWSGSSASVDERICQTDNIARAEDEGIARRSRPHRTKAAQPAGDQPRACLYGGSSGEIPSRRSGSRPGLAQTGACCPRRSRAATWHPGPAKGDRCARGYFFLRKLSTAPMSTGSSATGTSTVPDSTPSTSGTVAFQVPRRMPSAGRSQSRT